jgi:SRSO17 transposase
MTKRVDCPVAPAPLEAYAREFDDLFTHVAQRHAVREYLQGLLLPRERNKTITAIVGAEPVARASDADVQRLDSFVAESTWSSDLVHQRRIRLMLGSASNASHERGALILDDSGDRKWGTKMAYTARQYLGSIGKVDHGIVAVTSLWADEAVYYPLHVRPYIPAKRLAKGKQDPAFATKPQLALRLVDAALEEGVLFRAVMADCSYGEDRTLVKELNAVGLPYVVTLKPSHGVWAKEGDPHSHEKPRPALCGEERRSQETGFGSTADSGTATRRSGGQASSHSAGAGRRRNAASSCSPPIRRPCRI